MLTQTQPNSVRAARLLFFLLALVMAVFAVLTVRHGTPMWVASLIMLDAVLLDLAGWLLARRSTFIFFAAFILAAGNIVAIFFDEIGPVDLALQVAFSALLLLLIVQREQFLPAREE
jgi:hypothetical protein